MITYPTGRVLGVVDDPGAARELAAALLADGFAPGDVEMLAGPDGLDRLGRLGPRPNPLSRVVRAFQFLLMDQMPDFLVYERAIAGGRAVIAVRVPDRASLERARAALDAAGGHFLNHFGRLTTEELTMWRGDEPSIPDDLRR